MNHRVTSPWLKFEGLLADWLKNFETSSLIFKNGFQAIPGFPSNGFRADGLLTNNKILLALEVEVKQTHPDTNVGKYWLLSKYKSYQKIILFHVYTPEYNSYPWRLELGKFYASQMKKDISFEYLLIDKRDAKNVDVAYSEVTKILKTRIGIEFINEISP